MKTSIFFTVLFEHLFLFLLGVFVGGGCTLFYAVYIVDQTVRSCERKMEAAPHNGSSSFLSAEADHQSCYTLFTTFIAALGLVALLYALFKSYRYYQQNCPKAPEISTTTTEGETEKGGGGGDTELGSAIKMTTSPSEGGKNNRHNNFSFLLTPRQASALLPSSLEHSKSTTSIRTDPSLKGATTPPDHLK